MKSEILLARSGFVICVLSIVLKKYFSDILLEMWHKERKNNFNNC